MAGIKLTVPCPAADVRCLLHGKPFPVIPHVSRRSQRPPGHDEENQESDEMRGSIRDWLSISQKHDLRRRKLLIELFVAKEAHAVGSQSVNHLSQESRLS